MNCENVSENWELAKHTCTATSPTSSTPSSTHRTVKISIKSGNMLTGHITYEFHDKNRAY